MQVLLASTGPSSQWETHYAVPKLDRFDRTGRGAVAD
jgi:hypothetical protein